MKGATIENPALQWELRKHLRKEQEESLLPAWEWKATRLWPSFSISEANMVALTSREILSMSHMDKEGWRGAGEHRGTATACDLVASNSTSNFWRLSHGRKTNRAFNKQTARSPELLEMSSWRGRVVGWSMSTGLTPEASGQNCKITSSLWHAVATAYWKSAMKWEKDTHLIREESV